MPTRQETIRYELAIRKLEVTEVTALSSNMVRIEAAGADLEGFRSDGPTDHVKLLVPSSGEHLQVPELVGRKFQFPDGMRVAMRDYTVRRFDPSNQTLTIDVVAHGHGQVGSWAGRAQAGDEVLIAGPRGSHPMPMADNYLLVGDQSSLPAISRWLEELPPNTTGMGIIAVNMSDEIVEDSHQLKWVTRGTDGIAADALVSALVEQPRPDGDSFIWAAGEVIAMRAVRDHLRDAWMLRPEEFQVDGYWRRDESGYDHHRPMDD